MSYKILKAIPITVILAACLPTDAQVDQPSNQQEPPATMDTGTNDPIAPFVDQAAQNPEFQTWRAALLKAVVARNTDKVIRMASPDIKLSFGDAAGRSQFGQFLRGLPPNEAYGEDYWQELERVLRLGGRFERPDLFTAPYSWSAKLPDSFESVFETYFVIGRHKPVFATPSTSSKILALLSEAIIEVPPVRTGPDIVGEDGRTVFHKIRRIDGSLGYMLKDDLHALVGYRAFFERRNGTWQMTIFIAGD